MYYDIPASLREGGASPWGAIEWSEGLDVGIVRVGTAGHGGFHLSAERNMAMPREFRNANGWYEEDCERHLVVLVHPGSFKQSQVVAAHERVKLWWPDRYEKWMEKTQRHAGDAAVQG